MASVSNSSGLLVPTSATFLLLLLGGWFAC